VFGIGTGITLLNFILRLRRGRPAPADPWMADSLEWSVESPPPEYNFAEIPTVSSRHPLWEGGAPPALPALDDAMESVPAVRSLALEGAFEKTSTITSGRDTRPSDVLEIPAPTVVPLVAAFGLAVFFVGLLIDAEVVGVLGVAIAIVAVVRWLWQTDTDRT
jgi:cytochrome c oxidase subunit I+III